MTMVVGWNSGSEVYLCTDSVVSSGLPLSVGQSSLGEQHIEKGGRTAQEGALKIYRYQNAGLGISSNDAYAAIDLAKNVEHLMALGGEPEQAFRQAIISTSSPGLVSPHRLAFGYLEEETPTLLAFNQNGTSELQEVPDFVSLGSVSVHRDDFMPFLQDASLHHSDPNARLLSLMAALQQYSVRDYLMAQGVGGVYSGLAITKEGTSYQPDTLLVVQPFRTDPNPSNAFLATARVRHDCLFVSSQKFEGWRMFGHTRYGETSDAAKERRQRAGDAVLACDHKVVDYAMVIATDIPHVIIVKMGLNTTKNHLEILNGTETAGQVYYSTPLQQMIAAEVPPGPQGAINISYLSSDD